MLKFSVVCIFSSLDFLHAVLTTYNSRPSGGRYSHSQMLLFLGRLSQDMAGLSFPLSYCGMPYGFESNVNSV